MASVYLFVGCDFGEQVVSTFRVRISDKVDRASGCSRCPRGSGWDSNWSMSPEKYYCGFARIVPLFLSLGGENPSVRGMEWQPRVGKRNGTCVWSSYRFFSSQWQEQMWKVEVNFSNIFH